MSLHDTQITFSIDKIDMPTVIRVVDEFQLLCSCLCLRACWIEDVNVARYL